MQKINMGLVQKIADETLANYYHTEFTKGDKSVYTIFRGNDAIALVSLDNIYNQPMLILRETKPDLHETIKDDLKKVAKRLESEICLELLYINL